MPKMRYMVIGWDDEDEDWKVIWWGTNLREGRRAFRRALAEFWGGEIQLIEINTLAAQPIDVDEW